MMSGKGRQTNWFRIGAVIALIPIIIGYAYYLMRPHEQPVLDQTPETIMRADVLPDGSVVMDGQSFSNPDKLKAKIDTLQSAHPHTSFYLRAPRDMKFEALGKAALLFQKSGAYKVVFVTPPKPAPAKNDTTKNAPEKP
jgi:biopolymer transport protein ExbD